MGTHGDRSTEWAQEKPSFGRSPALESASLEERSGEGIAEPEGPQPLRPRPTRPLLGSRGSPRGSVPAPVLRAGERGGPAGEDDGRAAGQRVSPGRRAGTGLKMKNDILCLTFKLPKD